MCWVLYSVSQCRSHSFDVVISPASRCTDQLKYRREDSNVRKRSQTSKKKQCSSISRGCFSHPSFFIVLSSNTTLPGVRFFCYGCSVLVPFLLDDLLWEVVFYGWLCASLDACPLLESPPLAWRSQCKPDITSLPL